MWVLSVEFEMERELLHMVVGECEIQGKVGNTIWYVCHHTCGMLVICKFV